MKCLKCGSFNSEAAVYCQSCATYLAEKPGIEYFEIFKALVLALLSSAVFYLIFPMPVTRSEYLIQLFSGRISELIFTLTLWSLFLIFFKFVNLSIFLIDFQNTYSFVVNNVEYPSFGNSIFQL